VATSIAQPAPAPVPLVDRVQWIEAGPSTSEPFVDVALHPSRRGVWAVVSGEGGVWVTTDSGADWTRVLDGGRSRLGGISDDEQVLLDVSARVEEIVDDVAAGDALDPSEIEEGDDEALDDLEEATAAVGQATEDVVFGVQTEVAAGQWLDDLPGAGSTGRPRVRFVASGELVVARQDGIHRSLDLGSTWAHPVRWPVSDVAEVAAGQLLAVGPGGAWVSTAGSAWQPVRLPMATPPADLVVDGGTFASGPDGLWFASGGRWQQLPGPVGATPVTVRPTSATATRALVVSTGRDLARAPRPDAATEPVTGGPLPGVVDLGRLAEGTMVAATGLGPYVSEDDGRSWALVDRGLLDPRAAAVAVAGQVVVLVGAGGVHVLAARPEPTPTPEGDEVVAPPFLPLGALIESASRRRELQQRVGRRLVAAAIPQVTAEVVARRTVGPDWENDDPAGTAVDLDTYWQARTILRWTPGRTRSSRSFDAEVAGDEVPVVVVGRDVVVDDGEAPQVLYSRVSRGAGRYRSVLAQRITELYRQRARLILQGEPVDALRRVVRLLRIQELEATLDVLTDGAVTRWRLDPTNRP